MAARHTEPDYATVGQDRGIEWVGDVLPPNVMTMTKWRCPEGHTWDAKYNNIQQGTGCRTCAKKKQTDRSAAARHTAQDYATVGRDRGIEWIGEILPPNARTKTKWRCPEEHEFDLDYNKIQNGRDCTTCGKKRRADHFRFGEEHYQRAGIGRNIKWIGKVAPANARTLTRWKCKKCGYEWPASLSNINHKTKPTGCAECAGLAPLTKRDYFQIAAKRGIKWLGRDLPKNNDTRTRWRCNEGHEWDTSHRSLQQDTHSSGCPFCSETGFDLTIPAIAYYIRIETGGGPLYKIGVTNRTVAERFSRDINRIKIKVIKEWEFNSGIEAWEFERAILSYFQDQRYDGPLILTQMGNTEIFEVDVLDLDE